MKNITKIVFLGVIIALIVFGKQYIDKKTFKYEEVVDKSINEYFIYSDPTKLNDLKNLLDNYSDDESTTYDIQAYSGKVVWDWLTYIDNKYSCDRSNKNSCQVQLEEFQSLNNLINTFYNIKSKKGLTLMLKSTYSNIATQITGKITGLEKTIKSPSAKNPLDSEQVRQKKCAAVQDCSNCRDGVCTCTYIDGNRTEEIRCNKETD